MAISTLVLLAIFVAAFIAVRVAMLRTCSIAFQQGFADAQSLDAHGIKERLARFLRPMRPMDAAAYLRGVRCALRRDMNPRGLDGNSSAPSAPEGSHSKAPRSGSSVPRPCCVSSSCRVVARKPPPPEAPGHHTRPVTERAPPTSRRRGAHRSRDAGGQARGPRHRIGRQRVHRAGTHRRMPSQRRHIAIGSAIVSSVLTITSGSAAITA
jgi:hypothetical protein